MNNWDLVDLSSKPIVGGHLQHRDRAPLYALARSELVWNRRIAMVGSQWFLRAGETEDLFALAALLLDDRHDLMHKAVGWSLREAGKRDPSALRRFLDNHLREMPRTALRYAIEHFDEPERRAYLLSSKGGRPPLDPPRRANNARRAPEALVPRKGNLLTLGRRPGTHLAAFSSVALRLGSPPSSASRCTHLNAANRQGTPFRGTRNATAGGVGCPGTSPWTGRAQ